MAQGGDPTGTGTGGGQSKIRLNNIPFVRGSIGLARTPASKDISNDSHFSFVLPPKAVNIDWRLCKFR